MMLLFYSHWDALVYPDLKNLQAKNKNIIFVTYELLFQRTNRRNNGLQRL